MQSIIDTHKLIANKSNFKTDQMVPRVGGNFFWRKSNHQCLLLMTQRVTNFVRNKIEWLKASLQGKLQEVICNHREVIRNLTGYRFDSVYTATGLQTTS